MIQAIDNVKIHNDHGSAMPPAGDRMKPVVTGMFDDLHGLLESLRRRSSRRELAMQRLEVANRHCQAGRFHDALVELQTLAGELHR